MAILASFIGVDKYADSEIRELTGAGRDATALWALFSDNIPNLRAELLIDEKATVQAIRDGLRGTLTAAESDDIVIISFSGHGSHDHRIAAYDTSLNALANTTISMEEIANLFRQTQAKIVLCILDCCFSGGAPARVLETSPIPRDIQNPYSVLAGEGRVLIAASNYDELSYELPGADHGLLTKALIEVLQDGSESIDLQAAIGQVMDRVRAEAARMGVVQTPVMVGTVAGGLTFPVLKPGKLFFEAFPELRGIRVGRSIEELANFNLPAEVLSEWSTRFGSGLNDLQLEAVNEHRILDGDSLLVVAPTSSGKTFVGEMAAVRAIVSGRKAAFLLPYKALVNEKYDQFSSLYHRQLGFRVIRCTGDRLDDVGTFIRGRYDLALLTYEMFLGLVVGNPSTLNQLGLVVIDESQFITDPFRGITVELLLTYLLASREKGISPQLIALSAVIGDINKFDEWLRCRKLVTSKRPVPLTEGVLDRDGVFEYVDPAGQIHKTQLLRPGTIRQRRSKPSSQDVIVPLVKTLLSKSEKEQVIIFRNRRGPAEGCAAYLSDELGLPAADNAITALPTHDLSSSSSRLQRCLRGGTAFHNTNLLPEEKEVVERGFRDPNGNIRVLAATTTVAAGINTPASTVILAEQEFKGEDGRPFTVAEYKNMAGRAGRLGFNEEGQSIILAETSEQRKALFQRYPMGTLESLRSSFDPNNIETWILRLLAQIGNIVRTDVVRLLSNTYGGYLAVSSNPDWRTGIEQRLEALLTRMIELGLVEQEEECIHLTLLGQVCGRSSLSFASLLRLISLLRNAQTTDLTINSLAALVQGLPELDRVYTPIMKTRTKAGSKIVQSETRWPRDAAQRYGNEIVTALQRNADDMFDYYARCKRALILLDWTSGTPMQTIEQNYSATVYYAIEYSHIKSIADTTRFHLRPAAQIATVMFVDRAPSDEDIERYLVQLEMGIPADAVDLLAIPVVLTRGEYLTLYQRGIRTVEQLWELPTEAIAEFVGVGRAEELKKARQIKEKI